MQLKAGLITRFGGEEKQDVGAFELLRENLPSFVA